MPPLLPNKNTAGYPYSRSPKGLAWRQSPQPGINAIPYSELANRPQAVLDYMRAAHRLLAVEHGWETIALVLPYQAALLGAQAVKQVTEEQVKAASLRVFKESLNRGALVLALGEDREPGIIITTLPADQLTTNFAALTSQADEAITADRFMQDPESGQAFASRLSEDFSSSSVTQNMKYARQKRL